MRNGEPHGCKTSRKVLLLPPRSTAGQLTLDQHIGVRIPGGQPKPFGTIQLFLAPLFSAGLNSCLWVIANSASRIPPEALTELAVAGVAAIHEAMGRAGLMKPYKRPAYRDSRRTHFHSWREPKPQPPSDVFTQKTPACTAPKMPHSDCENALDLVQRKTDVVFRKRCRGSP